MQEEKKKVVVVETSTPPRYNKMTLKQASSTMFHSSLMTDFFFCAHPGITFYSLCCCPCAFGSAYAHLSPHHAIWGWSNRSGGWSPISALCGCICLTGIAAGLGGPFLSTPVFCSTMNDNINKLEYKGHDEDNVCCYCDAGDKARTCGCCFPPCYVCHIARILRELELRGKFRPYWCFGSPEKIETINAVKLPDSGTLRWLRFFRPLFLIRRCGAEKKNGEKEQRTSRMRDAMEVYAVLARTSQYLVDNEVLDTYAASLQSFRSCLSPEHTARLLLPQMM